VHDPATGLKLADVANLGPKEAEQAIPAANAAWPAWRNKTAKERSIVLRKWYHLLIANVEDLGSARWPPPNSRCARGSRPAC
jgi:succinate-semialdehyde dehydrogenase / glutarate-semialdehyde dehydrogenase